MSRSKGFTLVELLLAVSLMSMLLALAYGGLRAATRAADKGQTILEDSSRIRMAHQFVRKQLNQAVPLAFAEDEADDTRVVFEGSAQSIRYVAPMPGYLGFGGLQVQELAIVPGRNGMELVLSHALLQEFEEARLYEREPILLVGNIASGEFNFLGRDEESGELTSWSNSWDSTLGLPLSVSLDLEFEEEVYIDWPLLMASLRVDASAVTAAGGRSSNYRATIQDLINKRKNQQ
ncbi:MAG: prepilin-type N-terminal cleavage/methylation domain-containing protein [Xanthomonadales bacterium]|nr:prepilin-type N-terminal cleavage/methylation domain-containing protein [Xanthomonadales bacterium]